MLLSFQLFTGSGGTAPTESTPLSFWKSYAATVVTIMVFATCEERRPAWRVWGTRRLPKCPPQLSGTAKEVMLTWGLALEGAHQMGKRVAFYIKTYETALQVYKTYSVWTFWPIQVNIIVEKLGDRVRYRNSIVGCNFTSLMKPFVKNQVLIFWFIHI